MPDGSDHLVIRTTESIGSIDADAWDRCAGALNPFVSHAFLKTLEESGSVSPESGWLPQHMVLEDPGGAILGVMPLYLKNHSMGEYVFDYGWADAYERAGGRYYPKLLSAVPFTPVPGPRLLVPDGDSRVRHRLGLLSGLVQIAERMGVTNAHLNFLSAEEAELGSDAGLLHRTGHQYHWHNAGYGDFDDFLGALASRKRKAIRKERREVADAGITLYRMTGDEISARTWDVFYRFYVDTYDRKWGYPYLTRAFFEQISAEIPDRIMLVMAEKDGNWVAGALNLCDSEAVYGRNWGCAGDFRFLHFETCYYQAIEFAIERGLLRVEAGTQGPHKVQRGYLPVETHSLHWIADSSFRDAVERFLLQERDAVTREMEMMAEHSPFRQDPSKQR